MYRSSRLWTMRQYAGFGTAQEANQRYHYLLAQGTTGLSVAFDLPTQMGYDADHPMAARRSGPGGRCHLVHRRHGGALPRHRARPGLDVDDDQLDGVHSCSRSTCLAARRQGADSRKLNGTIQNDILKEYIARGTYIYPPRQAMRMITDTFAWAGREVPEWNTISISGYHIREAGSTAIQEVAFTLANGIAYIQAAIDAGLPVDAFAPRLSFFFNAHNDFFEEIAKFRAARRLYARIMRDRFGATNPKSHQLRFHTQTSGATLTAQQPDNNVVRVALQAMAAVLGGTQSLHTNSRDEALSLPTADSALLALRTQQMIAFESGVAREPDPLGGSEYVERLTDEVEAGAEAYLDRIDGLGGAIAAIEQGYIQREIQNAAYEYQRGIESGKQVIVGVNRFAQERAGAVPIFKIDETLERQQVDRLRAVRASRSAPAVAACLDALEQAARSTDNLLPFIYSACEAHATVGEISDRLRRVFGEYHETGVGR